MGEENNQDMEIGRYRTIQNITTELFQRQFERIQTLKSQNSTLLGIILAYIAIFISVIAFSFQRGWYPTNIEIILIIIQIVFYASALINAFLIFFPKGYKEINLLSPENFEKFIALSEKDMLSGLIYYLRRSFLYNQKVYSGQIDTHIRSFKLFLIGIVLSIVILIYGILVYIN
jgi:uncharacterized membrane protein